jgi:hypothetical protein
MLITDEKLKFEPLKAKGSVMICIGLGLALGLVCLCGTDMMGLDLWDWTSGTGTV